MPEAVFQPLTTYVEYPVDEMRRRATSFREQLQRRRTVRHFSTRAVPRDVIEECLLAVGIATGLLITAIHHAGLVSLTHTPSPMGFLNRILGVDAAAKPYLLLVVGYPAEEAQVPVITKKTLDQIAAFV